VSKPSVLLFDRVSGGHHAEYVARVASAIAPRARPVLAVSASTADASGVDARVIDLQAIAATPIERLDARREHELLRTAVRAARPDAVIHLYADEVLPFVASGRPAGAPTTLLLFRPRAHYRSAFGSALQRGEALRGAAYELAVATWRRRREAQAVLALDEVAAARWDRRGGAPARWLPEPPVLGAPSLRPRCGAVLYGRIADRKGLDRLAAAIAVDGRSLEVVLAGEVYDGYRREYDRLVTQMRDAGATVRTDDWNHGREDGLRSLAAAEVAVLPYPRHLGMSRVLLEAATVGTPVVAHDFGLVGHLVRTHGLGIAADVADPRAFRRAITTVQDAGADTYAAALARFSARYGETAFSSALEVALP